MQERSSKRIDCRNAKIQSFFYAMLSSARKGILIITDFITHFCCSVTSKYVTTPPL